MHPLRDFISVTRAYLKLKDAECGSDEALAYHCLKQKQTFRLGEAAANDRFIGFKQLFRGLSRLFSNEKPTIFLDGDPTFAIHDSIFERCEDGADYLEFASKKKPGIGILLEELPSVLSSYRVAVAYLCFSLPLAIVCFFRKRNRSQKAMIIREIIEQAGMKRVLREAGIRTLADMAPYEKHSNWSYLLHAAALDTYIKIPSPNPLQIHNAILLCDQLVISSGYHVEEINQLSNIRAKKVVHWPPKKSHRYLPLYSAQQKETPPKTLGFYSHGAWLRKQQQHSSDGLDIDALEEIMLSKLSTFLHSNPTYHLILFLHPKERKEALKQETISYYARFFNPDQLTFTFDGSPSTERFHECDIGIVGFSTIFFERILCGFKTLVCRVESLDFPLRGSAVNALSIGQNDELAPIIEKIAPLSNDVFFTTFNLSPYRFDALGDFAAHSNLSQLP